VNDSPALSERDLIRAAARGDELAFRRIVELYEPTVAKVVTAMIGVGDDADDVGQQTFIRLFNALPQFRGDATIRTYLTRIAINLSIDVLKKRKRRVSWLRFGASPETRSIAAPDETTALDRADMESRVRTAVDELDPNSRAVVVLRILEERSTRETAEILRVPEGTVMSRLKRAMQKLESQLRPLADT
jgi:RNA polymerase sigma-70 factor, ECF subfamily